MRAGPRCAGARKTSAALPFHFHSQVLQASSRPRVTTERPAGAWPTDPRAASLGSSRCPIAAGNPTFGHVAGPLTAAYCTCCSLASAGPPSSSLSMVAIPACNPQDAAWEDDPTEARYEPVWKIHCRWQRRWYVTLLRTFQGEKETGYIVGTSKRHTFVVSGVAFFAPQRTPLVLCHAASTRRCVHSLKDFNGPLGGECRCLFSSPFFQPHWCAYVP